jgi:hypothetical protein
MKINLHYSKISTTGDIPVIEFDEISDICDFIEELEIQDKSSELLYEGFKKVFLLTDGLEIFVTQEYYILLDVFRYELFALFEFDNLNHVHLFECGSYREAYDLALMIKENENLSESLQTGVVGQKIG